MFEDVPFDAVPGRFKSRDGDSLYVLRSVPNGTGFDTFLFQYDLGAAPDLPVIGTFNVSAGEDRIQQVRFAIENNIVYAVLHYFDEDRNDKLRVIDFSNPASPVSLGEREIRAEPLAPINVQNGVVAIGTRYYKGDCPLLDCGNGLLVYDASDPADIVELYAEPDGGAGDLVFQRDDWIYLFDSDPGDQVIPKTETLRARRFEINGDSLVFTDFTEIFTLVESERSSADYYIDGRLYLYFGETEARAYEF